MATEFLNEVDKESRHDTTVEEAIEIPDKLIMAICYVNRVIAVSAFSELQNILYADAFPVSMDDMEETIRSIKLSLTPNLLLLHPQILGIQSMLDLIVTGVDGEIDKYPFIALKSSVWNLKSCTEVIFQDLVVGNKRSASENSFQILASVVDIENEQLRQSLGALLSYMREKVFHLDQGKIVVSAIKQFPLKRFMRIDASTFRSLQIFTEEVHPNVIKGKGRSKEGFSLFGVFDRTQSLPGRQKLREWMQKPFYDREKIVYRQLGVALMKDPLNREFVKATAALLRHVHNLPKLLLRVKKVEATHSDWGKIYSTLAISVKILEHVAAFCQDNIIALKYQQYLREMYEAISSECVRNLAEELDHHIDFPESMLEEAVILRDGCDPVLDNLRHKYANLEQHLVGAAHQILQEVPLLQKVSVDYVPQVGYLVAVPVDNVHLLPTVTTAILESPTAQYPIECDYNQDNSSFYSANDTPDKHSIAQSFKFIYQQGDIQYFKHPIVEELDESLGDVKSDIVDRQKVLLLTLEEKILDVEEQLQQLASSLSTMDALISLGTLANEQNLTEPEISDDPVIIIKNGRHLLQELTVDNFVPNDTYLSSEKNVGLITGPNTSGKSVYLKQVGIVVYLAHIGSFVPCERAIIGLTDQIMTRISSVESVSAPQSAFALDLQQISKMVANCTRNSLCLVDEFGKGTTPVDGIALLAATVKYFTKHGGRSLFVLHFTEILHDEILATENMKQVACYRMEVIHNRSTKRPEYIDTDPIFEENQVDASNARNDNLNESACLDWEECTPLFKLKLGITSSSEGLACAGNAGVENTVIRRASDVKSRIKSNQTIDVPEDTEPSFQLDFHQKSLLQIFLRCNDWDEDRCGDNLAAFKKAL